jgi:CubicO group peptidase (beta-lactamase class C family)/superfamily II DNA or RNA helicase
VVVLALVPGCGGSTDGGGTGSSEPPDIGVSATTPGTPSSETPTAGAPAAEMPAGTAGEPTRDPVGGGSALGAATDAVFASFDAGVTPGCAVGVLDDGAVRHAAGYGAADLDAGEPITAETVFDIASVSKQITAGVVMDLVLDGDLSLDDPVADRLPDLDLPPDVTVGDLVHHTSGLPDYIELLDAEYEDVTTAEDALAVLEGAEADEVSGSYEYSNTGYFLLGQVVEAVTGDPLPVVAEARAFGPLGMGDTRIRDDQGTIDPGQAAGYEGAGRVWGPASSGWRQTGDGAVHTTVADLLRWAALFLDEPRAEGIGSRAWLDLMLTPGPLPDEDGAGYGGGIVLDEVDGEPLLWHTGSWIGVSSSLEVRPADGLAVAVLCNIDDLSAEALGDSVVEVWVDWTPEAPHKPTHRSEVGGPDGSGTPQAHPPAEVGGPDGPGTPQAHPPAEVAPLDVTSSTGRGRSSVGASHPAGTVPDVEIPDLADLDRAALVRVVGPAALDRGRRYAGGRVLHLEWDEGLLELQGVVAGNGAVYTTTAWFRPDAAGRMVLQRGSCTCPVQRSCKHVAAIALTAAGPDGGGRHPDRAAPVPDWLRALRPVLRPDGPETATGDPLGLALRVQAPAVHARPPTGPRAAAGDGLQLLARIVRRGRGGRTAGWVNGGLSWDRLDSWYLGSGDHPPEQVQLLRQMKALHHARTQRYALGSTATVLDLGEVGPGLWALLDEARRVGIELVHDHGDLGPVDRVADVVVRLEATTDPAGSTALRAVVHHADDDPQRDDRRHDDHQHDDRQHDDRQHDDHDRDRRLDGLVPIAVVGSPGHGLVLAEAVAGVVVGSAGTARLTLARLAEPLPVGLEALLVDGRPVVVPAADLPRFSAEAWPTLRRRVGVTSPDGSFTPPTVSGPALRVGVRFADGITAEVTAGWAYQVAGATRVLAAVPSTAGAAADPHEALRDRAAESALTRRLLAEIGPALAAADLLDPVGGLRPTTVLHGLATARLVAEGLPDLHDHPEVQVEVEGTPADFRDVGDRLVIGVGTGAPGSPEADQRTDWFDLAVTVTADDVEVPIADLLAALAAGEPTLLLEDGRYLSLDKPDLVALGRLLQEARDLQDPASTGLRISRYQADLWAELAALGVVTRQAERWQRQVDQLLAADPGRDIPVPEGLLADLRPYQREGFRWLAFLWEHGLGGVLADDMGLGKTVQALALACHVRQRDPDGPPLLVLAPTSVVPGWAAEAARFAPHLRVAVADRTLAKAGVALDDLAAGSDLVVTSYTVARLDADAYGSRPWSVVLLDEAQAVKNHRSKLYGAVRTLDATTTIAITGTPMENHLLELWSLLSITAPGLFPDPRRFEAAYARPIQRGGDAALLAQLRRRIRPVMTRRTKEQVAADLPPKQEQVLEVELHPTHRRVYDRQLQRERQRILGLLDDLDRNRIAVLRSLTVLRQLSLHAGLVDAGGGRDVPCRKLDVLVDHLVEVAEGGHRALVFSQFTRFLDLVTARLDAEGIGHARLDGSTRNRGDVIEGFKGGDVPVFCISLKAGGFGLNLTEADYVFLLDPWWNPAAEAQAIDRTHRIGQTRSVMVYRLIAADTIEQKVLALAQRKAELVRGVMADGDPFGGTLTRDDIRGLLG